MKVLPRSLPLVKHPLVRMKLYHHQAVMLDQWHSHDTFLLSTKTGTGKTAAAILPILKYKESAIIVYPTNALIRNQVAGAVSIAAGEGLKPCVYEPGTTKDEYGKADVIFVHIDAAALEKWGREKGWGRKWRVLNRLLERGKQKVIFTNPDILFLIFALRYRGEALAALQGFQTLVIDEFHMYQGVEFAHALFMAHLAREMGIFKRVLLLSATPDPEVKEAVGALFAPLEVDMTSRSMYVFEQNRTAAHEVEIIPCPAGADPVETAAGIIISLQENLRHLGKKENEPDYIPAVVVLNSVVNAIRLEDRLVEKGFLRSELLIIRGLSHRAIRQKQPGQILIIGTSAIEVGVDFKCDYLVFEAFEAPSFMQRFGRVGRHRPGTAFVICPENVMSGIAALNGEIAREEFETKIYDWYATPESRPWFVATRRGLLTVYALVENLISLVREGYRGQPDDIARVSGQLENIIGKYAAKINAERSLASVRLQFAKAGAGVQEYSWIKAYQQLNTFRTSLPSISVYDHAEKARRGEQYASYQVDLASLLHRAEGLKFEPKLNKLTVKGYGKYKKVSVIGLGSCAESYGRFFQTKDFAGLSVLQNDHCTPVSQIMTLKNHIFTLVPRSLVEDDWRLPVFSCGRSLLAFDGAALLVYELYMKNKKGVGV